ncbi:hypothetical protein, partial [Klebsiella pneumoniae]|uniref:hypothetical protein n=1 Tax=Klebsiella pneumoniae TaxID=573 RepID=UPI0025A00A6D
KRLCVNGLSAAKVDVTIDTLALSADTKETPIVPLDEEPSELQLPFDIELDSAELNAVNIQVDEMQFTANRLNAEAKWLAECLSIKQLSSEGLFVLIPTETDTAQTNQ